MPFFGASVGAAALALVLALTLALTLALALGVLRLLLLGGLFFCAWARNF